MSKSAPHTGDPAAHPTTLLILRSIGHACLGSLLVLCFIWFLESEDKTNAIYHLFWTLIGHIIGGGMGNAIAGVQAGMSPWFIFFQSMLADMVIVLYSYTLFVSSFRHAAKWRFIGPKLVEAHDFALQYKDRIKPYGVVGLVAFVIFPLGGTGPLVGSIIGYMIGLGTFTTFVSVLLATIATTATYILAYDWIQQKNSAIALAILILGVVVVAFAAIFAQRKVKTTIIEKREHRQDLKGPVIDVKAEELPTDSNPE